MYENFNFTPVLDIVVHSAKDAIGVFFVQIREQLPPEPGDTKPRFKGYGDQWISILN